ncbi:MAG: permease-like cell division protein FtsX [Myxococcales bacterium]|nr:permease-like cell division protein FtsX [Myxococcales bacterium]MCB9583492.1 ABC transporter permease [Polyangiaceae bacterium]
MTPIERAWRGSRNDWRLHLLSIFSVAVAFVCLASALLVVVNVHGVQARWAESGRASVYLTPEATPEQIQAIQSALRATQGVTDVHFVSSEDARREVVGESDSDVLAALPAEAFPASLEVHLADDDQSTRVGKLSAQLDALPAVESVETYQAWGQRLGTLLAGGVTAAIILAIVVLAAVISVVSSTIRLTLQRRRIEVEILKLVGATDSYVRRPFVVEGAAQGAIGAALAILILGVLYAVVRGHFDAHLAALLGVAPSFLPWTVALAMVALGGTLGASAAYASLRKLLVV